jgi:hypothetical protein
MDVSQQNEQVVNHQSEQDVSQQNDYHLQGVSRQMGGNQWSGAH